MKKVWCLAVICAALSASNAGPTTLGGYSQLTISQTPFISPTGVPVHVAFKNEYGMTETIYTVAGKFTIPTAELGTLYGFCIDLSQYAGTTKVNVTDLEQAPDPYYDWNTGGMGPIKANAIRQMWGTYFPSLDTQSEYAGFALAIWELVYEDSGVYDVSSGSGMKVTDATPGTALAAAIGYAQSYLNSSTWTSTAGLVALTSGNPKDANYWQDYVVPVPAPAGVLLGTVGVGIVGWLRRRRTL